MRNRLHLQVLTPSRLILDLPDVDLVACHMRETGLIEILPGHMPLLGATQGGILRYKIGDRTEEIKLSPGLMQVEKGWVRLFVVESQETDYPMPDLKSRFARTVFSLKADNPVQETEKA